MRGMSPRIRLRNGSRVRFALAAIASLLYLTGAYAQIYRQITTQRLGCQQWKTYEKIQNYVVHNDKDGFRAALVTNIANGNCLIFQPGEQVVVEDRGFVTVKLRPKGSMLEYWTVIEAILGE